jgi:hypothetical protein
MVLMSGIMPLAGMFSRVDVSVIQFGMFLDTYTTDGDVIVMRDGKEGRTLRPLCAFLVRSVPFSPPPPGVELAKFLRSPG